MRIAPTSFAHKPLLLIHRLASLVWIQRSHTRATSDKMTRFSTIKALVVAVIKLTFDCCYWFFTQFDGRIGSSSNILNTVSTHTLVHKTIFQKFWPSALVLDLYRWILFGPGRTVAGTMILESFVEIASAAHVVLAFLQLQNVQCCLTLPIGRVSLGHGFIRLTTVNPFLGSNKGVALCIGFRTSKFRSWNWKMRDFYWCGASMPDHQSTMDNLRAVVGEAISRLPNGTMARDQAHSYYSRKHRRLG